MAEKKFGELTQSEAATLFSTAMKSALSSQFGAPGAKSISPSSTKSASGKKSSSGSGGGGGGKGSDGKDMGTIRKEMADFSKAMRIPADAAKFYNESLDAMRRTAEPVLNQFNEIQEAYGGLSIDLDKATGSSKAIIDRLSGMKELYYDIGDAGEDTAKKIGFSQNIMNAYFKDEAAAFNAQEAVLGQLVEQHSQYINQIDDATLYKLPFYTEALNVNSTEVAKVVERQILLTGEAQTTILDDVAKFSQGLAKTTGVPLKSISANAVQIINDTKRLGDVTAEEATRISATLGQLGQTYDSLTGVMDKFQEFGSSAETAGLISQITGGAVNLDAQELMYLASEEQEKFLPELRRSLLAGGFDKNAFLELSNAEQRQLLSTMNMQRENFIALVDRDREFSEQDLIAAQEEIAADKTPAAKAVEDQLKLAPKAFDDANKAAEFHRAKALVPLEQQLLNTSEAYSDLNDAVRNNVNLTDSTKATKNFEGMLKDVENAAETGRGKIENEVDIGVIKLGEVLSGAVLSDGKTPGTASIKPAAGSDTATAKVDVPPETKPPEPIVDDTVVASYSPGFKLKDVLTAIQEPETGQVPDGLYPANPNIDIASLLKENLKPAGSDTPTPESKEIETAFAFLDDPANAFNMSQDMVQAAAKEIIAEQNRQPNAIESAMIKGMENAAVDAKESRKATDDVLASIPDTNYSPEIVAKAMQELSIKPAGYDPASAAMGSSDLAKILTEAAENNLSGTGRAGSGLGGSTVEPITENFYSKKIEGLEAEKRELEASNKEQVNSTLSALVDASNKNSEAIGKMANNQRDIVMQVGEAEFGRVALRAVETEAGGKMAISADA